MLWFNTLDQFPDETLHPRKYVCVASKFDALSISEDDAELDEASEVYVKLSLFSSMIVESGLITRKQFVQAGRVSSATGLPLGRALVLQKAISESRLATILDVCQQVTEGTLYEGDALESLNFVLHHFASSSDENESFHLQMRNGKQLEELLVRSKLLSQTDLLTAIEISLIRQESLADTLVALCYVIEPAMTVASNLQQKISRGEINLEQAVKCLNQIDWKGDKPTAEGLLERHYVGSAVEPVSLSPGGAVREFEFDDCDFESESNESICETTLTTTSELLLGTGMEIYEKLMEACGRTAAAFKQRSDYEQAESVYRRMLTLSAPRQGSAHQIQAIADLADLICKRGATADAAALVKQIVTLLETTENYDGIQLAFYLSKLARIHMIAGRYCDAEPPLARALLIREGLLPDGHPELVANLREYGILLTLLNRDCEAEKLFVQSHLQTI